MILPKTRAAHGGIAQSWPGILARPHGKPPRYLNISWQIDLSLWLLEYRHLLHTTPRIHREKNINQAKIILLQGGIRMTCAFNYGLYAQSQTALPCLAKIPGPRFCNGRHQNLKESTQSVILMFCTSCTSCTSCVATTQPFFTLLTLLQFGHLHIWNACSLSHFWNPIDGQFIKNKLQNDLKLETEALPLYSF